ncbi:MAG: tRNA 4-thiouridine(8) synthase ThiI [Planctomycetes bacterium]|nr:tRNA 4-thiouridine(8) synthase ThiI [Planctomycetota bacterium]
MLIQVRYDEISLKGGRRNYYESMLVQNLVHQTGIPLERVRRVRGRIRLVLSESDDPETVWDGIRRTFGVVDAAEVREVPVDLDEAARVGIDMARESYARGSRSFKVETKRRDKTYPMTSLQVSLDVGEKIGAAVPELDVDVHTPDVVIRVEVERNSIFVWGSSRPAPRGLPTGTSGRGLVLLSGGIDSPVAAWLMLKRGMELDAVHFHAPPGTGPKAKAKVATLARLLSRWTPRHVRLYYVKTSEIQDAIATGAPERLRIVLLRRSFYRIAFQLAAWKRLRALIGGEALGQVASQTPENLRCTQAAVPLALCLHPLIAYDKIEITRLAEKIGTYETSIQPHLDCCSLFAPKGPETAARLEDVEEAEASLDLGPMELVAAESREAVAYLRGEEVPIKR